MYPRRYEVFLEKMSTSNQISLHNTQKSFRRSAASTLCQSFWCLLPKKLLQLSNCSSLESSAQLTALYQHCFERESTLDLLESVDTVSLYNIVAVSQTSRELLLAVDLTPPVIIIWRDFISEHVEEVSSFSFHLVLSRNYWNYWDPQLCVCLSVSGSMHMCV